MVELELIKRENGHCFIACPPLKIRDGIKENIKMLLSESHYKKIKNSTAKEIEDCIDKKNYL